MSSILLLHIMLFITTALCKTCNISTSTRTAIECDLASLNTTRVEWQAYDSVSRTSVTLFTCEMTNCSTVTPLLNDTLQVTIEEGEGKVIFSVLVVPRTALYFNEYNQYRCLAGVDSSEICDTPSVYADVIDPTCDFPVLNGIDVTVICRALTHFEPKDFDFLVTTNNQTRSQNATSGYHETYSSSPIDHVPYYAAKYLVETDLNRLGPGYQEFILDVHDVSFGGPIASALLNVMSSPVNPECDYPVLTNTSKQLLVKCFTLLLTPQLVCDFNIRTNDTLVNISGVVSYSTSLDPNSGNTTYLSECTLNLNISQLGPGSHEFQVVMYTNGSHGNSTRVPGTFTSPYLLTLPTARLSDFCIAAAKNLSGKFWSTMSCYCVLGNHGNPYGEVTWYVNNQWQYGNIIIAFFKDFENNISYECRPRSPLMNDLPGVQLKIDVPRTPYITSFTANSKTTNITVDVNTTINFRCYANGFPPPFIFFGQNNSEHTVVGSGRVIARPIQQCEDAGLYCCKVLNSSNYFITEQCISVFVNCPLVPQIHHTINFTSLSGKDAEVTIPVVGFPGPTHYILTRADHQQAVIDSRRYEASFVPNTPPYGEISLTLLKIQEANFTTFNITFGNGLGQDHSSMFLLAKGRTDDDDDYKTRNIALGVSGGVLAVIIVIVVIVLVKKGSCSSRKRKANYDTDRFTQLY